MVELKITLEHHCEENKTIFLTLRKEELQELILDILGTTNGVDNTRFYLFVKKILIQRNQLPPYYSIQRISLARRGWKPLFSFTY